jgi:AcrR family transcriptional regulator
LTPASRSVGRRPGSHDTRGEILAAARRAFSARGYDATSVRSIAHDAAVDPSLVHHYFGQKERLFVAAMQLPIDPTVELPLALEGDRALLGERLVALQLRMWGDRIGREALMGLVRSASSSEAAAAMLREFLGSALLARLSPAFRGAPDADLRAAGVGSQLVGMAFARYVVRLPAMVHASDAQIVSVVGSAVQSYFSWGTSEEGNSLDPLAGTD